MNPREQTEAFQNDLWKLIEHTRLEYDLTSNDVIAVMSDAIYNLCQEAHTINEMEEYEKEDDENDEWRSP